MRLLVLRPTAGTKEKYPPRGRRTEEIPTQRVADDQRVLGLVLAVCKAPKEKPLLSPPYNIGISLMSRPVHSPHTFTSLAGGENALPMLNELAALQFCQSLSQFLLGVHDDRTVPGNRLLNRLARYQEKTDAFVAGLNDNLIAAIEEHERVIAGLVLRVGFRVDSRFSQNRARIRCIPECA